MILPPIEVDIDSFSVFMVADSFFKYMTAAMA